MNIRQLVITTAFCVTVGMASANFYTSIGSPRGFTFASLTNAANVPSARPFREYELEATPVRTMPRLVTNSLKIKLRNQLEQKRFQELNTELGNYQIAATKDIKRERELSIAYDAFEIKDESYAVLFDEWIATTPNAYPAYVARASYRVSMGWASRGHNWARETQADQIEAMRRYFDLATQDLDVALKLDEKGMMAYRLYIEIYGVTGEPLKASQMQVSAAKINAASYLARVRYMHFISPRWGGSFEKMKSFAEESLRYEDRNPRLRLLVGDMYTEAGEAAERVKQYTSADELFTNALAFGESPSVYKARAIARYRKKDFDGALSDINRAIELNSEIARYYYWRANILTEMEPYENAADDVLRALELAPWDEYHTKFQKWLTSKLVKTGYELNKKRDSEAAVKQYSVALRIDPLDPDVYFRRALEFYILGKYDAAQADVKRAIILDPTEFSYYERLDRILVKSKDWNQIIAYWDKYVDLKSDDPNAYFERAGTHYHNGNMSASMADAKRAADLGHLGAKEMYEKFKHLAR